jgi:hypothetical protein
VEHVGAARQLHHTASPLARQQDFERAAAYVGFVAWLPFLVGVLDTIRRQLIEP